MEDGWHEFFIICIFFLMAAQMFNSSTDWLFNIPWWLTVPLAQPAIGCLFSNGGWQCLWPSQNWLPNLTLAGNQDTRIQYFFYPCLQAATCQILSFAENPRWSRVWQYVKVRHKTDATLYTDISALKKYSSSD